MPKTIKLKCCPVCKDKNPRVSKSFGGGFFVYCATDCPFRQTHAFPKKQDAVKSWNLYENRKDFLYA